MLISYAGGVACTSANVTIEINTQLLDGLTEGILAQAPPFGPFQTADGTGHSGGYFTRERDEQLERVRTVIRLTLPSNIGASWDTVGPGCGGRGTTTLTCVLTTIPFSSIPEAAGCVDMAECLYEAGMAADPNSLPDQSDTGEQPDELSTGFFANEEDGPVTTVESSDSSPPSEPEGMTSPLEWEDPDAADPEGSAQFLGSEDQQTAELAGGLPSDCFGYAAPARFSNPFVIGRGRVRCVRPAFIDVTVCMAVKTFGVGFFSFYKDFSCGPQRSYFAKVTPLVTHGPVCQSGDHKYRTHLFVGISRGSQRGRGSGYQRGRLHLKNC
ncbi:MAG: hypothetical protein H0T43_04670 [Solirubrobacterales bacterium]|nr:hypothetical protein [Solirubrobacterales bacterium]